MTAGLSKLRFQVSLGSFQYTQGYVEVQFMRGSVLYTTTWRGTNMDYKGVQQVWLPLVDPMCMPPQIRMFMFSTKNFMV